MSVAIGMEAGRRGRHGDSAARRAGRASSYVSVPVTIRRLGTVAECVWGRVGMKGEKKNVPLYFLIILLPLFSKWKNSWWKKELLQNIFLK